MAATDQRQRRREAGASLLEFAIIMPVLFMLIIAMITGGMTLSRNNSVENAVREATRFGAVHPNPGTPGYLSDVLAQAERAATGDLGDGVDAKHICVAYIAADGTVSSLRKTGASTSSGSTVCFTDGLSDQARVQVVAERNSDIQGVFWSTTAELRSQSVTRYER